MADKKYLLMVWKGRWVQDGPDHGRGCLFESPKEAVAWASKYKDDDIIHEVIEVTLPDAP